MHFKDEVNYNPNEWNINIFDNLIQWYNQNNCFWKKHFFLLWFLNLELSVSKHILIVVKKRIPLYLDKKWKQLYDYQKVLIWLSRCYYFFNMASL